MSVIRGVHCNNNNNNKYDGNNNDNNNDDNETRSAPSAHSRQTPRSGLRVLFLFVRFGRKSFEQHAPEAAPEVLVEYRVDDRVDGRVHVAQPKGYGERLRRYGAHGAQRRQYVHEEERQPARDERAHDQAQYKRGAFLFFARDPPLLALWVARLGPGRRLLVSRAASADRGQMRFPRQRHLSRVQYVALRLGRRGRLCRLAAAAAAAEYRLAQPRLDRLDHAALLHVARVRRRRLQLAHHVRVHGHAGRPAPAAAADRQVAVDRQPPAALRGEHFQRVLVPVLAHVAGARVAGVVARDHRQCGADRRDRRRAGRLDVPVLVVLVVMVVVLVVVRRHLVLLRGRPRDEARGLRRAVRRRHRRLFGRGSCGRRFRLGRLRRRFPDAAPRSSLRREVYPDVHEHHDARRYVERAQRRVYPVTEVLAQLKHKREALLDGRSLRSGCVDVRGGGVARHKRVCERNVGERLRIRQQAAR